MFKIALTQRHYQTLKDMLFITDKIIQEKIEQAKKTEGKFILHLTRDELEELAEYIAAEANHAEDKVQQQRLDDLYDAVNAVLTKQEWIERFERLMQQIEDEISDK